MPKTSNQVEKHLKCIVSEHHHGSWALFCFCTRQTNCGTVSRFAATIIVPNGSKAIKLNDNCIDWVNEWTYLGVVLVSGPRFGCCVKEKLRKFYCAANAILRVEGRSDDVVMLRLLEAHCVSLLTYAIEVIHVSDSRERQKMRVAYNSIFRNVFNYTWRQSVTDLQHTLQRPTWEELVDKCINNFLKRICSSELRDSITYEIASRCHVFPHWLLLF